MCKLRKTLETIIPVSKKFAMADTKQDYLKEIDTLDGKIPILKDIWNFFNTKGMKTNYLSFNSNKSFAVDLEISETLGCPLHLIYDTPEVENRWKAIIQTLKERKISEENKDCSWLAGVDKRWILARNLKTKLAPFTWTLPSEYCKEHTLQTVDFLKMEGEDDKEKELLYSFLHNGYRPSLVLIKWSGDPDASVPSMLAAGHLQTVGYRLLKEQNGWFLYLYTDVCIYDTCSWRETNAQNPMVEYFLKLSTSTTSESEKKNSE